MREDLYKRKLRAARYSYRKARMIHHRAVAAVQRLAVLAVCFLLLALLCGWACKVWATHPAEQPIDGRAYMEMVQGWVQSKGD